MGMMTAEEFKKSLQKMKVNAYTKVLPNWTAGLHGPGTWHGAGSTQTQMIALHRAANLEAKKRIARKIAGIED